MDKNKAFDYAEKGAAWDYAFGLLKIDGLEPSPEYLELVEQEKRGEITTADIKKTLDEKYSKLKGSTTNE